MRPTLPSLSRHPSIGDKWAKCAPQQQCSMHESGWMRTNGRAVAQIAAEVHELRQFY
jgi:hypothetical protein